MIQKDLSFFKNMDSNFWKVNILQSFHNFIHKPLSKELSKPLVCYILHRHTQPLIACVSGLDLLRQKQELKKNLNTNSHSSVKPSLRVYNLSDVQVLEKIGQGAFGSVYKGKWEDSTFVALKKLHSKNLENENEFFVEAKTLLYIFYHFYFHECCLLFQLTFQLNPTSVYCWMFRYLWKQRWVLSRHGISWKWQPFRFVKEQIIFSLHSDQVLHGYLKGHEPLRENRNCAPRFSSKKPTSWWKIQHQSCRLWHVTLWRWITHFILQNSCQVIAINHSPPALTSLCLKTKKKDGQPQKFSRNTTPPLLPTSIPSE